MIAYCLIINCALGEAKEQGKKPLTLDRLTPCAGGTKRREKVSEEVFMFVPKI